MPDIGQTASLHVASTKRSAAAGVARLPAAVMAEMNLSPGDPVEIVGRRHTAALASPLEGGGAPLERIELSEVQRINAGVGVGEQVEVRPLSVGSAKRVVLRAEPDDCTPSVIGPLHRSLLGQLVHAGDALDADWPDRTGEGGGEAIRCGLEVVSTTPRGAVRIGEDTVVEFVPRKDAWVAHRTGVIFEDVNALGPLLAQLREVVELPLRRPEVFERLGVAPHKGVLLRSVGGLRNPRLARAVAVEFGVSLFPIAGSELASLEIGEAEKRLAGLFEDARTSERPVIFIDELHLVAPRLQNDGIEPIGRLKAKLLSLMDGIAPEEHLIVVGATHRPDALDPDVREVGRFDRELVISPPDLAGRREFLTLATRGMPLSADVDLQELAEFTAGYTRENLAMLVREAALEVAGRVAREETLISEPAGLAVGRADFLRAMKWVSPSALYEVSVGVPAVTWDDVGALSSVKDRLRRGVVLPLRASAEVARLGVRPARGFLLFGPPGNGKSLLASAAAQEAGASFLSAGAAALMSKSGSEAELVAALFARAREVAPAVIFIDELDRLTAQAPGAPVDAASARRLLNALIAQLDATGKAPGVVVIGSTWRPNLLEAELLRAGRFEEIVYVPVPDRAARRHVLEILTRSMPLADDVDLDAIATETDRYTGADLRELVRAAGLVSLDRSPGAGGVDASCFLSAINESRASVTQVMERAYEEIAMTLKQEPPRHSGVGFAVPQAPT